MLVIFTFCFLWLSCKESYNTLKWSNSKILDFYLVIFLIAGLFLNTKKLKKKGKGAFYSRYKKMAWHVHIYFDTLFLIPIKWDSWLTTIWNVCFCFCKHDLCQLWSMSVIADQNIPIKVYGFWLILTICNRKVWIKDMSPCFK